MANNPKIHTVTGEYNFAVTGGGATGSTTLLSTGAIPKGAKIKSITLLVGDALAHGGSFTHFDVYLKGATVDVKAAEFAEAGIDATGDIQTAVPLTTTGLATEELEIGFRCQGAVLTGGAATVLIEYIN